MKTRINYGQGQASAAFNSVKQCNAAFQQHRGGWMERQDSDTGEWFPCDNISGAFLDMTAPKNADHPAK